MGGPLKPIAILAKIGTAITTVPDHRAWRRLLLEAAWSIPVVMALCYAGGLMRFGWTDDPALLLRLALIAIIAPAIGEELLFRVIMLPPPGKPVKWWRYVASIALFVVWHPPQAILYGEEWGGVVLNVWFLGAVAVLGIALTRLYIATGSIWPPVVLHWTVIVGWKAFFGAPSPWTGS